MLCFIPRSSTATFQIWRHVPRSTTAGEHRMMAIANRQFSTTQKNTATTRLQQESSDSTESSETDNDFMRQAIKLAKLGSGHTYPNPPVGCILVDESTGTVLGKGFHPRAGYPHAEIFALLEAAGHVQSGSDAAQSIVKGTAAEELLKITETYKQKGGEELFANCCMKSATTTAYVTLEPCCHYGQTPPCALSLVQAGVSRVIIGTRDPNPRVDGGGVQILQQAGITVDLATPQVQDECRMVVRSFLNRITPGAVPENYDYINGKHRRALRALSGDWQRLNKMNIIPFGKSVDMSTASTVELSPEWLEFVDSNLWNCELVKFKLLHCEKKKAAQLFADRLAEILRAHVTQVVGHTFILYRPGVPHVLDLEELINLPKTAPFPSPSRQQRKQQRNMNNTTTEQ